MEVQSFKREAWGWHTLLSFVHSNLLSFQQLQAKTETAQITLEITTQKPSGTKSELRKPLGRVARAAHCVVKCWNCGLHILVRGKWNKAEPGGFRGSRDSRDLCTDDFSFLGEELLQALCCYGLCKVSHIHLVRAVDKLRFLGLEDRHVDWGQRFLGYVYFDLTPSDFLPGRTDTNDHSCSKVNMKG